MSGDARYTAHPALHAASCVHCGMTRAEHHRDWRCCTPAELETRIRVYHQTGRWPGPDEQGDDDA